MYQAAVTQTKFIFAAAGDFYFIVDDFFCDCFRFFLIVSQLLLLHIDLNPGFFQLCLSFSIQVYHGTVSQCQDSLAFAGSDMYRLGYDRDSRILFCLAGKMPGQHPCQQREKEDGCILANSNIDFSATIRADPLLHLFPADIFIIFRGLPGVGI